MSDPAELEIDAWIGRRTAPRGPFDASRAARWARGARNDLPGHDSPRALPPRPDLDDPTHPAVGWGLLVPRSTSPTSLADIPEPLHELVTRRNGRIFRPGKSADRLYSVADDRELAIAGSRIGSDRHMIPAYLLLYATPAQVPWRLQTRLATRHYVGRIDLVGEALARYVRALLDGFGDTRARARSALTASVVHDPSDITGLMHHVVARPIHAAYRSDPLAAAHHVGGALKHSELRGALTSFDPGVVVTTSHGCVAPLDVPAAIAERLGLPVDAHENVLDPTSLVAEWSPAGAIWYAHACCSAGCEAPSQYASLFARGSEIAATLAALEAVGAQSSVLGRALLSAQRPARAFIGRVEPTFDWTLRHPETHQPLTAAIVDALYARWQNGVPIGRALSGVYDEAAGLLVEHLHAQESADRGEPHAERAVVRTKLTALDRLNLIVYGDPAVALSW